MTPETAIENAGVQSASTPNHRDVTTVTVRQLRSNFKAVEAKLAQGCRVRITRRGTVVAEMVPTAETPLPHAPAKYKMPDFMARLKEIWGDTPWDIDTTAIVSEGRERDPVL